MGKNSVPRSPLHPRSNRVQGSTHSVKARAGREGASNPRATRSLRSTQTPSHRSVHALASPLALSSPSSVLSQYLRAAVPTVPSLSPCTQARAQIHRRAPDPSVLTGTAPHTALPVHFAVDTKHYFSSTKHYFSSTPALSLRRRAILIKLQAQMGSNCLVLMAERGDLVHIPPLPHAQY